MFDFIRRLGFKDGGYVKDAPEDVVASEVYQWTRRPHVPTPNLGAINAALALQKAFDGAVAGEGPSPFRIVKIDSVEGESGYFVQASYLRQRRYRVEIGPLLIGLYYPTVAEQVKMAVDFRLPPSTSWEWRNVGSANPHATYEEAAEWLRKWLRPETGEVAFDAQGNPI